MLNYVGVTFLALFLATLIWDVILTALNIGHMRRTGAALPEVFQSYVDRETYEKSVAYNLESERFGLWQTFVDAALLIALIYFGGFQLIDEFPRSLFPGGYYSVALMFAAVIMAIKFVIDLPFDIYGTFVIEQRHGFNRTTPKLFISDLAKGLALAAVIGAPLYLAVLWFMSAAGKFWWLWAWMFLEIFQLAIILVYPVWIAPLFNKFSPLKEEGLRERILQLAKKAQFPLDKIFVMDGSKRSAHSNAYFTGLGRKKRIVLFDTLINQMEERMIISVLAHEIGHYKLKHILKSLLVNAAISLIGVWALSLLIAYPPFFHGLGFAQPSNYAALIIFSLCASTLAYLFKPIMSVISRRHEYQADRFAVATTRDKQSMADVIASLTKENLSNLNPHPLYSFFHYSHPAPVERVRAILDMN